MCLGSIDPVFIILKHLNIADGVFVPDVIRMTVITVVVIFGAQTMDFFHELFDFTGIVQEDLFSWISASEGKNLPVVSKVTNDIKLWSF